VSKCVEWERDDIGRNDNGCESVVIQETGLAISIVSKPSGHEEIEEDVEERGRDSDIVGWWVTNSNKHVREGDGDGV
jgi:hypothetical protein